MNFLSNALSLLSTASIPYTIKEKIVEPTGNSDPIIWTVYDGVNPKNDAPVTIFEFNLKNPALSSYVDLAKNCFKKLKLIKIPEVISIIDFIENESFLYIVTEPVTPLATYLKQNQAQFSKDAKVYGLFKVVNALVFINSKANCVHGNLNMHTVWVNAQGDWKLFGFETLTNLSSDPDQPIYRYSKYLSSFNEGQPPEVKLGGIQAIQQSPMLLDSYRLGVFVYQLFCIKDFSQVPFPDLDELASKRASLPQSLAAAVQKLVGARRITTDRFLQETQQFFDSSPLVEFSNMLEEVKYADDLAKLAFFKHELSHYINNEFPPGYLDNKLLPDIVDQFFVLVKQKSTPAATPEEQSSRQEAMSTILNHILTLSDNLSDVLFTKLVAPAIFQAFTLPDRSIRLSLLKHLSSYAPKLQEQDVQNKIFPNLLTGFQDTNFLIRETTLTSMTLIIDKVSVKQINNDLLKVLAKLQMDPKPSIRTNTLILIIKISGSIYSNSRNNVMITALSKALRDSFTPCKMAALSGFDKLIDNFGLEEKCTKVLGHLAVSLMDPKSHKVRTEAKRLLQKYLDAVEDHAANFSKDEEDEDAEERDFMSRMTESTTATQGQKEHTESGGLSFGWNMVNKFVSSEPSAVSGEINPAMNRSTPDLSKNSAPAVVQDWNDDDENTDSWGADDDFAPEAVSAVRAKPARPARQARPIAPVSAVNSTKREPLGKKREPLAARKETSQPRAASSRLKLGGAKKMPGSTLKLDLKVDDAEEDAWGGDW